MSAPKSNKEFISDFKKEYAKVRHLLEVESKNDAEDDPFQSKCKAKIILYDLCNFLKKRMVIASIREHSRLTGLLGTCLLDIASIDLEMKDFAASEMILKESVELLNVDQCKSELVVTLINVYNNVGILWSNKGEQEKAKVFLMSGKKLYDDFKCALDVPFTRELILKSSGEFAPNDFLFLEKAHNITLLSLAQVLDRLTEILESTVYCHVALKRQLQYGDYEPIEWSLKALLLSLRFAEKNGFYQAKKHMDAASKVLAKYGSELNAVTSTKNSHLAKLEMWKQKTADVAKYWIKYCVALMSASAMRLFNPGQQLSDTVDDMSNIPFENYAAICGGDIKSLIFPSLIASEVETNIKDTFLLNYQDAQDVVVCSLKWLNEAEEFYKIDTHIYDYIELKQDSSKLYNYLAAFEEDKEKKIKLQEQRVNILQNLVMQINPQFYIESCRQLWFNIAIGYSDILDIKLEIIKETNEKPTPLEAEAINMLCETVCLKYELYLDSWKGPTGELPTNLSDGVVDAVIKAYAYVTRTCMKRIMTDSEMHHANTVRCYNACKAVIDLYNSRPLIAGHNTHEYLNCINVLKIMTTNGQLVRKTAPVTADS